MNERRMPRAVQQIEDRAWAVVAEFQRLLIRHGQMVPAMPPVPVMDIIAELAGLDVQAVADLEEAGQRLSGRLDPQLGVIAYAATESPGRCAFTVAHELGHYYLHHLPTLVPAGQGQLFAEAEVGADPSYFRCADTDMEQVAPTPPWQQEEVAVGRFLAEFAVEQRRRAREVQANQFAAALLMPAHLVAAEIRAGHGSPVALAARLGVSPLAAEIRLRNLGYHRLAERKCHPDDEKQAHLF
jgi:Zn-dependent peptidase ImmA (M78 family)